MWILRRKPRYLPRQNENWTCGKLIGVELWSLTIENTSTNVTAEQATNGVGFTRGTGAHCGHNRLGILLDRVPFIECGPAPRSDQDFRFRDRDDLCPFIMFPNSQVIAIYGDPTVRRQPEHLSEPRVICNRKFVPVTSVWPFRITEPIWWITEQ